MVNNVVRMMPAWSVSSWAVRPRSALEARFRLS